MNPIHSLTRESVTMELVDLAQQAAPIERRLMGYFIDGRLQDASPDELCSRLAALPATEQSPHQLYDARRLVAVGQKCYGPLDPVREPKRDFIAEAAAEASDLVVYLLAEKVRGNDVGTLLDDAVNLKRRLVEMAHKRGSL